MAKASGSGRTLTINTDLDAAHARMDEGNADRLVLNQKIGGKTFTVLEIERIKKGALKDNDNNNNFC